MGDGGKGGVFWLVFWLVLFCLFVFFLVVGRRGGTVPAALRTTALSREEEALAGAGAVSEANALAIMAASTPAFWAVVVVEVEVVVVVAAPAAAEEEEEEEEASVPPARRIKKGKIALRSSILFSFF